MLISRLQLLYRSSFFKLTADLPQVFALTLPLLSNNRWYIRRFAAETFSFLLRRLEPQELSEPVDEAFAALEKVFFFFLSFS